MQSIYPAPNRWFRYYLKRKKCICVQRGSSEIWRNGINKTMIAGNCIFHKPICKMKLRDLKLSFEEFELAIAKHKARYKRSTR